ncbi:MAG: response regulator [Bacteroidales bacterium]
MNLANRLLKFFSFKLEDKCEKDHFAKLLSISVASFIMIALLLVHAVLFFASSQSTAGIVSGLASVIVGITLIIAIKKIQANGFSIVLITVPAIFFLYLIWSGNILLTGSLAICLLPIIAVGILGYNRGAVYSLVFLFLAVAGLFAPLGEDSTSEKIELTLKILFIFSYLTVLFAVYLLEAIKAKSLQNMEKQLLDQKNTTKLKEEFIAKLSHQIRTPLNNIMVIANILESVTEDEKQKDMIDTIHASTNNLVNVVNSMVEISNVDIKERGSVNLTFNLYTTINSTIKLFSTQDSSHNTFSLNVNESIPDNLIGDPVRIKQIFLNLIENILKNKSSDKISININIEKGKETLEDIELLVKIKSNKPILLPLNEGHNLYVTNESSLTSASTQMYIDLLEMSITQKLIESNGGKLSIALSSEDAVFSFPYIFNKVAPKVSKLKPETEPEEPQTKEIKEDMPETPSVNLEDANVLLVEDNLINQKIVVLSLKKVVKNIEIANNGKEALDKFGTSRFDIILMDIQMPIMNGIVATKKIREIESSSNSHTPIVAITANALLGDKEECLAAGMDDYISKPFQIEVLIQKMKNLLKR